MSFFEAFTQKKSARVAADRLKITLQRERANASFDFLDQMKDEILEVVRRYTKVREMKITADKNQRVDRLEIEIELDIKQ